MASATARADRLAELLPAAGVDLLLVADRVNLRYLTGFTGTNGLCAVGQQTRLFLTDFRYLEQAAEQVAGFDRVKAERDLLEGLAGALPAGRLRVGFDESQTTVRMHRRLAETLGERVELVGTGPLVAGLRATKSPEEIERIRAATQLADGVFEWLIERGLRGRTERAVARELEEEMRRRGASEPSFPSIVAAGVHSASPHAEPRDVEIPADTLVTVDIGARLDGYCSDGTRTFATGELADDARSIYELVLDAQLAALQAVGPGREGRAVDAVARDRIAQAGHAEHFGHGLGHGVGLEIHEAPRLSQSSDDLLAVGNVVSVEPGVYLPGGFGVRTEDLVVVRQDGCEVLSGISKELTVVA